jgi:glycerophosphoryl diester phosphodiesterase
MNLPAWPYPLWIAHRGAGKLAPENTLAAIRHGASFGYRMCEVDAKLSGDGQLMLMHDETLQRTTNAIGRVAAHTWAQLSLLDAGSWHSPIYAGEPIARLQQALAWIQANGLLVNIEIKPCPGREAHTGAAVALEVQACWQGPVAPLLSSFSETALEAARQAVPSLPRALLMHQYDPDWLARCLALGCVAFDANHHFLTKAIIDEAHQAGLRVLSYTVNDDERAQQLIDWGLDGVITDRVDVLGSH